MREPRIVDFAPKRMEGILAEASYTNNLTGSLLGHFMSGIKEVWFPMIRKEH